MQTPESDQPSLPHRRPVCLPSTPAFGLAEAVADSGDLYGCSEIHRHIGFYYLVQDVRPGEAARGWYPHQ